MAEVKATLIDAVSDGALFIYLAVGLLICWAVYGLEISPFAIAGMAVLWPFMLIWWALNWILLGLAVLLIFLAVFQWLEKD